MMKTELGKFKYHAIREYPNECCGLLLKSGGYVEVANVSNNPRTSYKVDPQAILDNVDNIQVVLHSHPNGPDYPSEADMVNQIATNIPMGIVSTDGKDTLEPFFWGDGYERPELVGRGFRHGVTDCYSLIRDFYAKEMGFALKEIPREWLWWETAERGGKGEDLYTKFIEEVGFKRVTIKKCPEVGDMGYMQIKSDVPNHACVYIGKGLILHHLGPAQGGGVDVGCLSVREPLAIRNHYVKMWLRHEKVLNK